MEGSWKAHDIFSVSVNSAYYFIYLYPICSIHKQIFNIISISYIIMLTIKCENVKLMYPVISSCRNISLNFKKTHHEVNLLKFHKNLYIF